MTLAKTLLKPLLLALSLLPIAGCSSLFKPKTMTIEYEEEVKLHDGEMIWVHITRHYGMVGGVSSGHSKSYMPGNVEISWDTGFEGVGRKSVFFDEQVMIIDKDDSKWYIVGGFPLSSTEYLNDSINCRSIGVTIKQVCIAALNQQGEFVKANVADIDNFNSMNVIHPFGINDWGSVPKLLDGTKVTWDKKLSLESQQDKKFNKLEMPIQVINNRDKN